MSESVMMTASVAQVGPGSFQYSLTLHDVGTTAIGGLWIAWAPGSFFLPDAPTTTSAPSGWTATPVGNSVQYAANSSASYVESGGTLTGFSFTAPDAPDKVFAASSSGPPVLTSFAYETSAIDPGPGIDPGAEFVVACLATGTRILTTAGDTAVERLHVGDLVPTLTGQGAAPVRWIGHRRIDCRRHPRPDTVWPVRVGAGAFGPDAPARPLSLSPDHAVHVYGVLIPVGHLVNGATIVQEPADHVVYWHVELPTHGVLLAEGLPVESYLDTGNRDAFAAGEVLAALRQG